MILYFTGTGNSKYVAESLGVHCNDYVVNIMDVKEKELNGVRALVCPCYFGGIPSVVEAFLHTHVIHKQNNYCFFVATYGGLVGDAPFFANKALYEGSGIKFDAYFGVRMVDNYTPLFSVKDTFKNEKMFDKTLADLDMIYPNIKNRVHVRHVRSQLRVLPWIFYRPSYNFTRKTKRFKVNEDCTHCGLCESICPNKAIQIQNQKPVWVKKDCTLCLACVHRCPTNAISFGNSRVNGQYINKFVKL